MVKDTSDTGEIELSKEDHMRYFTTFVASLLADFWRYIQQENINPIADGIGYRQIALNLNDAEFRELSEAINKALQPFLLKEPDPCRRRRILSTIVMPEVDESLLETHKEEGNIDLPRFSNSSNIAICLSGFDWHFGGLPQCKPVASSIWRCD